MKANEAPENIYIQPNAHDGWFECNPQSDIFIEYTRTDAFVEKALFWLKNHYRDYMYNPTGKRLETFFGIDMCNDFENYLEG